MIPVSLLAAFTMWIAISYKWKRGVELFIALTVILFVSAFSSALVFCCRIGAGLSLFIVVLEIIN